MIHSKSSAAIAACVLALLAPSAFADDQANAPRTPEPSGTKSSDTMSSDTKSKDSTSDMKSSDMKSKVTAPSAASKLGTAEVMKITQTAMTHIGAAERALEQNNKKAAKIALAKSEKEIAKLYNNPALGPVMTKLDDAIDKFDGKAKNTDGLDLAPLSTMVTGYQEYLDPSVAAGVQQASERAQQGDTKGAKQALRLARNRVAIDAAFVPVEDAYIRVLAAQHALEAGNTKQAAHLLANVPIIVSELQVSQPLLPVRFKLHAAAQAAENAKWSEAESLLTEVDRDLQKLETASTDQTLKQEISSIADQVERIRQDAIAGKNPAPSEIRQLAQRVQQFGVDEEQEQGSGVQGPGTDKSPTSRPSGT